MIYPPPALAVSTSPFSADLFLKVDDLDLPLRFTRLPFCLFGVLSTGPLVFLGSCAQTFVPGALPAPTFSYSASFSFPSSA